MKMNNLFSWFRSKESKSYSRYCEGGELYERINDYGYFDETMSMEIFKQILHALHYMH